MTSTDVHKLEAVDPAEVTPDDVDAELLRAGLKSDENLVRTHSAQLTTALAAKDVSTVEPLVSTLVEMFDDERAVVLKEVLFALSLVAEADPDAVADDVGGVIDLFEHDVPLVRTAAARTVRVTAAERPSVFVDHVDRLLDIAERPIEDPTEGFEPSANERMMRTETIESVKTQAERRQSAARAVAVNVLVAVTSRDSEVLVDHVGRLADLLASDSLVVTAAAAEALASIAEEHPSAVEGVEAALLDALDVDDTPIRAWCVAALGFIDADDAVAPLRELAATTDDADLREHATETADFLDR